jgi:potassium-transporting ATPase KdpC subunit
MRRQLITGLMMTLSMVVLVGLAYPLAMTGIAQGLMSRQANGSFVKDNGRVVGSSLIGQSFLLESGAPDPRYFQPRPSAAGTGYDAMSSGGSNLGPSSTELISDVAKRVAAYRRLNGLSAKVSVPVDAVTASSSGLDPDISVANAKLQAPRVAQARKIPVSQVLALVDAHTDSHSLGILGEKTVNVLDLNLALDRTS